MSHPRKDFEIYGKEITVTLGEKSGNSALLGVYDGRTAYIIGCDGGAETLAAKTCADANEYKFQPLDGSSVISPSFISMAVGDTYKIKTGPNGVSFVSSDDKTAAVDKNGVITALAKGSAVIEATASDGTSYTIDVEVRPQPALYTLGDVNEDGKIDAKDASAVLVAYSRSSTGADNGLSAAQAKAANVNGDALVDAKDASAILAYYALASTSEGSVLRGPSVMSEYTCVCGTRMSIRNCSITPSRKHAVTGRMPFLPSWLNPRIAGWSMPQEAIENTMPELPPTSTARRFSDSWFFRA